jgi:hypothetical protein
MDPQTLYAKDNTTSWTDKRFLYISLNFDLDKYAYKTKKINYAYKTIHAAN